MTQSSITQDSLLKLSAEPHFVRQKSMDAVGLVKVTLKLRNTAQVTARGAFVSIPRVGIRVEPALSWCSSVRAEYPNAISLSCGDELALLPGQLVTIGYLSMSVRPFNGGTIGIGGMDRPLSALSNIRLFCVVGAHKYSPERVCLTVQSADIRRSILDEFSVENFYYPGSGWPGAIEEGIYA